MASRPVSDYEDKNEYIADEARSVIDEAREMSRIAGVQTSEPEGIVESISNVVAMDLIHGYNQWAQGAGFTSYQAFVSSFAQTDLAYRQAFRLFYGALADSIAQELVEAHNTADYAAHFAREHIDEMSAKHLIGGRPGTVAAARNAMGDTEATPIEHTSSPAAAATAGGGCLVAFIGLLAAAFGLANALSNR